MGDHGAGQSHFRLGRGHQRLKLVQQAFRQRARGHPGRVEFLQVLQYGLDDGQAAHRLWVVFWQGRERARGAMVTAVALGCGKRLFLGLNVERWHLRFGA